MKCFPCCRDLGLRVDRLHDVLSGVHQCPHVSKSLEKFMEEHCHLFAVGADEHKLNYMELYNQYVALVEQVCVFVIVLSFEILDLSCTLMCWNHFGELLNGRYSIRDQCDFSTFVLFVRDDHFKLNFAYVW